MDEIQGITTFLAGLTTLAMAVEAVKAGIWAVITALIFRRFDIVLVRARSKGQKRPETCRGCKIRARREIL